jgi:hypothetical protein
VLAHHFKKTVGQDNTDLDLDDFSFVGAAEFARQSLLIGRLDSYSGPRSNQLVIRTHGFGRGDRFRVHIDEGTLDQPQWNVRIEREQVTIARERRTKAELDVAKLQTAIITLMQENQTSGAVSQPGVLQEQIKKELGWSGARTKSVLVLALAMKAVVKNQSGTRTVYSPGASLPEVAGEEADDGRP